MAMPFVGVVGVDCLGSHILIEFCCWWGYLLGAKDGVVFVDCVGWVCQDLFELVRLACVYLNYPFWVWKCLKESL